MAASPDPDAILETLRIITKRLSEHSHRLSREAGLTMPQLLCLRAVAELGSSATVAEVAKRVHMGAPTVSGVLDRLERSNLVRRERGTTDRRRVYAVLTDQGADRLRELPRPMQGSFVDQLQALSDEERSRIGAVLASVASMLGARAGPS